MGKAIRDVYGEALVKYGRDNENVVVLDADVSGSTKSATFAEACPDRFFNMGIAEANIRAWGVSNLDIQDMSELLSVRCGTNCETDQVLYHLGSRGIEFDLLPFLCKKGISIMAYCPLVQAGRLRRGLLDAPAVRDIASNHHAAPAQVLLAFLLAQEGVIPIPRTGKVEHTLENAAVASLRLSPQELMILNQAFPAPNRKVPLDIQ